jgi:predicted choloylglycine hydrolase
MHLRFFSVSESEPGRKWLDIFERHWAAYETWFLSQGEAARPSYLETRRMLRKYMPELIATYERLVDLAGGSDIAARFLGQYCPPAYITGCSQAVWPDCNESVLVRNYDYSPKLCEGTLLLSHWNGRRVMAMIDCLWGVLDGINDAGLAVSLSFGGRRVVGSGFGVPIILRYILEFCETTTEATSALQRIPTHMSYNVTILDKHNQFRTVYVAPDRTPVVRQMPVATNHQGRVEWRRHAEATGTLERESYLISRLADSEETEQGFIDSFLTEPLYSRSYTHGFGTLYTTVYAPRRGAMELRWPDATWHQTFVEFSEQTRLVEFDSEPSVGIQEIRPAGSLGS